MSEIVSSRHLDLLIESFLTRKLYDNNLIPFDIFERIKEELDEEISDVIREYKMNKGKEK